MLAFQIVLLLAVIFGVSWSVDKSFDYWCFPGIVISGFMFIVAILVWILKVNFMDECCRHG